MTQHSPTKKTKKPYKCLSIKKRILLKEYLEQDIPKQNIAKLLGVSHSTIYREIKKGTLNGEYSPYFSQGKYEDSLKNRGSVALLSKNHELATLIANYILKDNLSPKRILDKIKELGYNEPTSIRTIYSAIDNGLIPNVTRENLKSDTTSLFSKGLIQIPKWVRTELNIEDGDMVQIKIENGKIIIEKLF